MHKKLAALTTLTLSVILTACADPSAPDMSGDPIPMRPIGTPIESGQTASPKKTTNPKACYDFQEVSAQEKTNFLKPLQGLWMSKMPGWMSTTNPAGEKILSKEGFEINGQKLGTVIFERKYMDATDNYQTRTYAEGSVQDARVSPPRQGGDWDGFRIVEIPTDDGGCRIVALKKEGEKLQVRGYVYRTGAIAPEEDFWKAELGFSEFKRTY